MSPTTTRHSRADSAQPPYRKPSLPRERAQSWSSWAQSEEDDTQSSYQHIPSHAAHSLLETTRRPSAASSTMSSSRDPSISLVSRNDSLALTPQTSHSSMAPASRTNSSSSTSISAIRSQASAHVKTGLVVNKSLDSWSKGWETAFEAKQRSRPSPQPSSSSSSSQKAHASSQLTTHPAQHIAHPARSPPNAALERRMSAAFMTPEEVSQRWYFCHSTGAATTARERWRGSRTDSLAGSEHKSLGGERRTSTTSSLSSRERVPSLAHSEETLGGLEEESGSESEEVREMCLRQRLSRKEIAGLRERQKRFEVEGTERDDRVGNCLFVSL